MDIVWKIKTFDRANLAAKKYRFARTFRLVENRLYMAQISHRTFEHALKLIKLLNNENKLPYITE